MFPGGRGQRELDRWPEPGYEISSTLVLHFSYSLALCFTHLYYWWKQRQLLESKNSSRLGANARERVLLNPAFSRKPCNLEEGPWPGQWHRRRPDHQSPLLVSYFISGARLETYGFLELFPGCLLPIRVSSRCEAERSEVLSTAQAGYSRSWRSTPQR